MFRYTGNRFLLFHTDTVLGSSKHRLLLFGALSVCSCVREPLDVPCLEDGALVVTEFRVEQGGSFSEWIELHNPTDAPVSLAGVTIAVDAIDDFRPERRRLLILQEGEAPLELEAGGYAVVGEYTPDSDFLVFHYNREYEVDSGDETERHRRVTKPGGDEASELLWIPTFADQLPNGTIALESCGAEISRLAYELPRTGTLALDGALDPGADNGPAKPDENDAWCRDEREDPTAQELGVRGSPGEPNPTCAELDAPTDPTGGTP